MARFGFGDEKDNEEQDVRDPHGGDEPAPMTSAHDDAHDEAHDPDAADTVQSPVAEGHATQASSAEEAQTAAASHAEAGGQPGARSDGGGSGEGSGSRVSVVDEQPPRPAPPEGASEDE